VKTVSRDPRPLACLLLASLLVACGGGGGDGGVGGITHPFPSGIRPVAGANVTDTVNALQAQALVVEVRQPDGRLAVGAVVRFEAQPPADSTRRSEPAVYVCPLSAQSCGLYYYGTSSQFTTDTTDAEGRAKALIRLGQVAGRAVVRLSVPEFGMVDSTAFTVRPGSAAKVKAIAPDTGLDIGASAMLRGHVTDVYNNPRSEQPVMSIGAGTAVTFDAAKATVTAKEMGTQWLYARYGQWVDSTSVRVVPGGRLVVWAAGAREVRLVNTNGSGATRKLISGVSSDFGAFPRFDPSRKYVTMHRGSEAYGGPANTVVVVDTATLTTRVLASTNGFASVVAEREMADGSLMVVGRTTSTSYALWKVTSDNTMTPIISLPVLQAVYDGADISHDGRSVAYIAMGANYTTELRVLDVLSGVETTIAVSGRSPRWSPTGDRLAYLATTGGYDGNAWVVNANGTGKKSLGSWVFSPGLGWSPDGAYVVGRSSENYSSSGLRLIRVSDGANVLLRFRTAQGYFEDYYQPDWR
jgi:hypothetical protein